MATADNLSRSVLDASDELVETACTICLSRDNKLVEAAHYCVDCDGNLCEPCKKWHEEFRATSGHQVLPVPMAMGNGRQNAPPLPTARCDEHHGKLLDTYCSTHQQLCCVSCVTFHHGKCGNLQYIPTISKGVRKSQEYIEAIKSIKDVTTELETIRTTRHDVLNKLNKDENSSQTSLQEIRQRLIKRIDDLTSTESEKITSEYQKLREYVQRDITAVEDRLETMKTCRQKLNDCPCDNESQLFVYMKRGDKYKNDGKELINTLARIRLPEYEMNNTAEKNLHDIHELGWFKRGMKLTLEAEHSIRKAEDKMVCSITGICMLSDGSKLLADSNNRALKQVNHSYTLVRSLDMSAIPFGICCTETGNEVAVTLPLLRKVEFINVGDELTKIRSFSVEDYCRGICCRNRKLLICCEDIAETSSVRICVYTLTGTPVRTIQVNQSGHASFAFMYYISSNSNGSKLYVTDSKNGVTTVDQNGTILSTCNKAGLRGASGICTLDDDEILVADFETNRVLYNGTEIEAVLSEEEGIKNPQALCFDRVNNKLIVGAYGINTIKVYAVA